MFFFFLYSIKFIKSFRWDFKASQRLHDSLSMAEKEIELYSVVYMPCVHWCKSPKVTFVERKLIQKKKKSFLINLACHAPKGQIWFFFSLPVQSTAQGFLWHTSLPGDKLWCVVLFSWTLAESGWKWRDFWNSFKSLHRLLLFIENAQIIIFDNKKNLPCSSCSTIQYCTASVAQLVTSSRCLLCFLSSRLRGGWLIPQHSKRANNTFTRIKNR